MMRAIVGLMLGLVARIWISTLRVRAVLHPALGGVSGCPWVLAHWHGKILPLLAFRRRRPTAALVSWSRDGDQMASALRLLGVRAVRGSSSRGGREGLRQIVELMVDGHDAVLAVDGPTGPRHAPKAGAIAAAKRAGGVIVAFAAHCESAWTLRGTWDAFEVPFPFSRVTVVLGEPVDPAHEATRATLEGIADAIHGAQAEASRIAGGRPGALVPRAQSSYRDPAPPHRWVRAPQDPSSPAILAGRLDCSGLPYRTPGRPPIPLRTSGTRYLGS